MLYAVGPYVTQIGVGSGGAHVSELYTTFTLGSVGYNIYGFGMQTSANITVVDDFAVPSGQSWTVSGIKWLSYQTGASTAGTITSMNLNLWNFDPQGQFPGNQWINGGDQWLANSWTGVYRVLDSGLSASNRAIIEVACGGAWMPVLSSGTYWLEANAGGTLASGPWAAVKVLAGQTPPTGVAWNGRQSVSAGAFAAVYDTGNPLGSINEPADFLFQIEGTGGAGGIATFCTSKTSSLGCTPTLSSTSVFADKSGFPATIITATPVPGGAGLPGLLIYSKTQPASPIATAFGSLCLSGFARAGAFPVSPGGTAGVCNGSYGWNVAAIAAGTASIAVGDVLRIQAWYRDPGFPPPGNANLTNGIDPIVVVGGSASPPNPSGVAPGTGGEGTPITISGAGFGSNPADLRVLLADGIGFADVTAVGVTVSATVFKVGATGTGAVTLIQGNGLTLSNQSITTSITSNSSLVRALLNGAGANFGSFTLTPSSANTVSASVGTPLPNGPSFDLTGMAGTALVYRLAIKFTSGDFLVCQGRVDFVGVPTDAERAEHLAAHINTSFGALGATASSSGNTVRVSMAGAVYSGIVVGGI